jgi:hypothetical protein
MSKQERLSPAGAEIVEALTEFYQALEQGPETIANRFTVRTGGLDVKPREYTGEKVKEIRDMTPGRPRRPSGR